MKVYAVLNHKGGVGKSTIATHIAAHYANKKKKVLLGDFDVQRSSFNWLRLRPNSVATINYWEINNGKLAIPPEDTDVVVIDAPAGCRGQDLKNLLLLTDKIIIPLQPGIFDILSTKGFLNDLAEIISEEDLVDDIDICIIGNAIIPKTDSTNELLKYIRSTGLDNPCNIRQEQIYKHLTANGLTLFDAKNSAFAKEKRVWKPLISWLDSEENLDDFDDSTYNDEVDTDGEDIKAQDVAPIIAKN